MTKKEIEPFLPKWRIGALSLKEFHLLLKTEKNDYIKSLVDIPYNERGDIDIYLLRFYKIEPNQEPENLFTL